VIAVITGTFAQKSVTPQAKPAVTAPAVPESPSSYTQRMKQQKSVLTVSGKKIG
jgi:hypothetical protein